VYSLEREPSAGIFNYKPQNNIENKVEGVKGSRDLGAEVDDLEEAKCKVNQCKEKCGVSVIVEIINPSFEILALNFFVFNAQG
jgi:hypothetical protein